MLRSKPLLIALAFSALLAARAGEIPAEWTWDDQPGLREEHAALEGKPMPPLEVTDWMKGRVKSEALKGKVVLVDFFATWCGPCMALIPHNNELLKNYKAKGLVVLGVCTSDQGQDKMEQTVQTRGIEYPTARDPKLAAEKAWSVHYYPTYALVDRKGIVRAIGLQPQHVEPMVQKLLAEAPAR